MYASIDVIKRIVPETSTAFVVPGTSQAALDFLARTSGLDSTHQNAYIALINGLVADGVWPTLDVLQVYAAQDSTTALLNLVSVNFTGSLSATPPTFTADQGFTGNGSNAYVDTGYVPSTSAINYLLNSAQMSFWNLTNRAGNAGFAETGAFDGANTSDQNPSDGSNSFLARLNTSAGGSFSTAVAASNGFFLSNRTGSAVNTTQNFYNGASAGAAAGAASTAIPTGNYFVLARNDSGSPVGASTDQFAAFSCGASLTTTQITAFYNRLHTYMQTIAGVP